MKTSPPCPKCGGATTIDINRIGRYYCMGCPHSWIEIPSDSRTWERRPPGQTFKRLHEAQAEHDVSGGILLINDDGSFTLCQDCRLDNCRCRTIEWVDSLAPSWSEAAPENAARDKRNAPLQGTLI